jgi:hypothetical protein
MLCRTERQYVQRELALMSEVRTETRTQGVKKRGAARRREGDVWLSPGEWRFEMVMKARERSGSLKESRIAGRVVGSVHGLGKTLQAL